MRVPPESLRVYLLEMNRRAAERDLRPEDVLALQALTLAGEEERVTLDMVGAVTGAAPREVGKRLQVMKRRGYTDSEGGIYKLTAVGRMVVEELEGE